MKELKVVVHDLNELLERPEVKRRMAELEAREAEEMEWEREMADRWRHMQ